MGNSQPRGRGRKIQRRPVRALNLCFVPSQSVPNSQPSAIRRKCVFINRPFGSRVRCTAQNLSQVSGCSTLSSSAPQYQSDHRWITHRARFDNWSSRQPVGQQYQTSVVAQKIGVRMRRTRGANGPTVDGRVTGRLTYVIKRGNRSDLRRSARHHTGPVGEFNPTRCHPSTMNGN